MRAGRAAARLPAACTAVALRVTETLVRRLHTCRDGSVQPAIAATAFVDGPCVRPLQRHESSCVSSSGWWEFRGKPNCTAFRLT